MKNLTIGTAAFGIPYGLLDDTSSISRDNIKKIILKARLNRINSYDTAPSYGNSQAILGNELLKDDIISTKMLQIKKNKITRNDVTEINQCFLKSLRDLNRDYVDTMYVHYPKDLLNNGGEYIYDWLIDNKIKKKIRKIGVSVFFESDLENILSKYKIDSVQLPLNILDQRFLNSGFINKLNSSNIEVNIRSIFLKGLLLKNFKDLPSYFLQYRNIFDNLSQYSKKNNLSIFEIAIIYVQNIKEINNIIIGIKDTNQLEKIITNKLNKLILPDIETLSSNNLNIINPSFWVR